MAKTASKLNLINLEDIKKLLIFASEESLTF